MPPFVCVCGWGGASKLFAMPVLRRPEFIFISICCGGKPAGQDVLTLGRFTSYFLCTTFMLTVFPLPVKVSNDVAVSCLTCD